MVMKNCEATGAIIAYVPFHPARELLDGVERDLYLIQATEDLEVVV
jgi:hypothetical protein